jgi:hypothetical protein
MADDLGVLRVMSIAPLPRVLARDRSGRRSRRCRFSALVAGLLAAQLTASGAAASGNGAPSAGSAPAVHGTYTGTLGGADFRVEVPRHWNGTLVLYSHGYIPAGFVEPAAPIQLTNSPETETWLLDHGVALAASAFRGVTGYQVEQGYHDQLALLDWFNDHIGRPQRTISTGQSMGAAIADLLAERNPDRFAGVGTVCAAHDPQESINAGLDIGFAIKTLLAPGQDIDLVRSTDPEGDAQQLERAIDAAMDTANGRARLALAASFNNVTGWWSAHQPRPTDPSETIRQQALWLRNAYVGSSGFAGPVAHVDLEAKAGGNPAYNVGIDYRRQLTRSSQHSAVRAAYRAAGLDLDADLARLAAAPRIAPDPAAVAFMYRTSVPSGRLAVPVVTLHSVGDGGAVPDQERWYAGRVRRHSGGPGDGGGGLIRQVYVDRGQHCSFSAADEIVALQTLFQRIETGRWPATNPRTLNARVGAFNPGFQVVTDLSSFDPVTGPARATMPPAFARFTPPQPQRPSV